jgi:hypothetical protein
MAGYTGTPLAKKLGIREGQRIHIVNGPESFPDLLGELPADVQILSTARAPLDLVLLFVISRKDLDKRFAGLAARLAPAGMLWVAWPKKSSGVPTDLNFDVVQRRGLDDGLVDTKICAVDDIWSGLRFVIRVKDRKKNAEG